jgi:hypothetical protein
LEAGPGQNTAFYIQSLRAGIVRQIWNSIGITLQGLSYVYHDSPVLRERSHAFEAAQLTINEILKLDQNGKIALVFKGYVRGGIEARDPTQNENVAAIARLAGHSPQQTETTAGGWLQTGGSIGVRIIDRLLASFFADYSGFSSMGGPGYGHSSRSLLSLGATLRYDFNDAISIQAYFQDNALSQSDTYNRNGGTAQSVSFSLEQSQESYEGGLNFIVRY